MKKCMICTVLLCLALAACTAVTQSPTGITTEQQMNATTTTATTTAATTVQTTTNPTTVTTATPTTSTQNKFTTCGLPKCYAQEHTYENGSCIYCGNYRVIGYVEKKAGLTEVELISGDQTVIPIGKMRTANTYDESAGRWLCALGSGVKFNSFTEEDIPVLNHVSAICIGIPEKAEFVGIFIQTERTGQGERTSLAAMAELAPGTYYVKIGLNRYGDTHEGRQESSYYEYGFKLVKTAV